MSKNPILDAVKQNLPVIAAHMDFEGIAILKVVRDGSHHCFIVDITGQIIHDLDFKNPACKKWKAKMDPRTKDKFLA